MKRGSRRPAPPSKPIDLSLFPVAEPSRAYGTRAVVAAASISVNIPAIPGATPESAISVELLTQQAKAIVEGAFPRLWIRGEVSDFKTYRSGHWYFCLRGASAQLKCVMFASDQRGMPTAPADGMQVVVLGQPTVYPVQGSFQCTVTALEAVGDGLWRKALDEATARLRADGLLEPSRKRAMGISAPQTDAHPVT